MPNKNDQYLILAFNVVQAVLDTIPPDVRPPALAEAIEKLGEVIDLTEDDEEPPPPPEPMAETLESWIAKNRSLIDSAIRHELALCNSPLRIANTRIDDLDRALWVNNNERLYMIAKRAGVIE